MSNNSTPEAERKVTDEAMHADVQRAAPGSKLALAAAIISVLALVARCEVHSPRQPGGEPKLAAPRATDATLAVDNLRGLQAMSATLIAKARQAQPGTLSAADCDRTDYEHFLAARNNMATQLDEAAAALGPVRYLDLNNQLMALAMSTAEASDTLAESCAGALQPRR
jgi:hypothetical protein